MESTARARPTRCPRPTPEPIHRFIVTITEGPDSGRSVVVGGAAVVIGTGDACDVRLSDSAVSRFHCELVAVPGGVLVRDLASKNGTGAAGLRLGEAVVPFGTALSIGRSRLTVLLDSAMTRVELSREPSFGSLVGRSVHMRRAFSLLERAARTDATVLLTGETGTGKEAAAEGLHAASDRANGPFVVVDCAAVPSNLFEAELFGHEKGAFTGASSARAGAFELADGGTLFIDELGELAVDLQPKLLRVLERREIKRVGGGVPRPVDVRIVSATHRDLRAEVNAKRFRADLYYRLAVVSVRLPALRERHEHLPRLVASRGGRTAERTRASPDTFSSPRLIEELERHAWPGNVRELRNYLERILVLGTGAVDDEPRPLPPASEVGSRGIRVERDEAIERFEREYIETILQRADGSASRAAQLAEVDRTHFYRLLWKYGFRTRNA